MSKEADYAQGTVTTKTYRNQNTAEQHKLTLDKYGRTEKIEENGKTTTFTRQVLPESAGASEVTFMCDPFENRTYKYFYDDFNNCTGVEIEQSNETVLSMTKPNQNSVSYTYGDRNYKSEVIYDEKKVLSPRIDETSGFVILTQNGNCKLELSRYTYDEFGRIKKKTHEINDSVFGENYKTKIYVENSYKNGTFLKSQIKTKIDNETFKDTEYQINHTYDSRGLFLSDTYKTTYDGETSTKVRSYTYDKSNRLKAETANGYTLEYAYNKDGTLCSETGGGVVKAYSYENGRLTGYIKSGDIARTEFEYDNYGNCTQYCKTPFSSTEIEWERGNLLKKIRNTEYEYNSSGLRFRKKTGSETTEYYYDGTKLLGENRNGEVIRYIYDSEGIIGFFAPTNAYPYFFVKDARNNVIAALDEDKEVAAYEYDAWGSCKVVKDTDGIGTLNPIRWKSQYYDSDSGFYYINNRFYSATTKQFLDGGSPETALANATTIYGLNPHNSTLTNPLSEVYNEYTIETETELVYDAPELNKWQYFWNVSWKRFWGSKLGKLLSLVIFIAATILAIFCPAFTLYYISAVLGTTVTLVIGATIAGFRNKESFVDGFNNYINEELAPAFAISLTLAMVSFGVSKAVQAIQNAAPKCFKAGTLVACLDQAGKETLKPIEEIEVGDKVLAYDEETGEQGYKEVVRLFRNETQEWYHVYAAGEEIICTAEHPFYLEGKGFVSARELKERDNLLLSDGSKAEIDSLKTEHVEIPETTYNFEVKDFHTYYVSHSNVLVHNKCGVYLYRGGSDMTLKNYEYVIKDGMVVPGKDGISLNIDPQKVAKFGTPHKVVYVPEGLEIVQKGIDLGHYVIRPKYAMPLIDYQNLLNQVVLKP